MASLEELSPAWLSSKLVGSPVVTSVEVESMSGAGGLNCDMQRLHVVFEEGSAVKTFVLKRTRAGGNASSKNLGLVREALFYKFIQETKETWVDVLVPSLVHVSFAEGDEATGSKHILMEDLKSAVQSGYFFGPHSPLNWGKDLVSLTRSWSEKHSLDAAKVTTLAFSAAAKTHAAYWNNTEALAPHAWLKGRNWRDGQDQADWEAAQDQGRAAWLAAKAKAAKGDGGVVWSPEVVAVLDASFAKCSWEAFVAELQIRPLTLVHGGRSPIFLLFASSSNCIHSESRMRAAANPYKI